MKKYILVSFFIALAAGNSLLGMKKTLKLRKRSDIKSNPEKDINRLGKKEIDPKRQNTDIDPLFAVGATAGAIGVAASCPLATGACACLGACCLTKKFVFATTCCLASCVWGFISW